MRFHSFNGSTWKFRDYLGTREKEISVYHESGKEAWEQAHDAMEKESRRPC